MARLPLLTPIATLDLSVPEPAADLLAQPGGPLGGAGPTSGQLAFRIEPQRQTNWCWAAVSVSVARFYDPASSWTQCAVADRAWSRQDCCGTEGSDERTCNQDWFLDSALEITRCLVGMEQRAFTFDEVLGEIGRGAVVGCRVEWSGGRGHFMVIVGWRIGDRGKRYIDIADPIYLDTQIVFDEFARHYHGGGDWTHSYRTRPQGGAVAAAGLAVSFDAADVDANGA
jgi:hypothetical protein